MKTPEALKREIVAASFAPGSRSTLADANESRDWRIYFELAQRLIIKARALYVDEGFGVELADTVYALDATTIDLCHSDQIMLSVPAHASINQILPRQ